MTIDTEGGVKALTRTSRDATKQTFRASMGLPEHLRQEPVAVRGERLTAVVLRIGNPQCVMLGPLPDLDRFNRLGAALAVHPAFPEGTNVEFAAVEAPDRVRS